MNFNKGCDETVVYPITNISAIPEGSMVSLKVGKPHNVPAPPSNVYGDYFQDQLAEVITVRCQVEAGVWPKDFILKYHPRDDFDPTILPQPLRNEGLTTLLPKACAQIVHMDLPMQMPQACLRWLLSQGAPLRTPYSRDTDFLGKVPQIEMEISKRIWENLNKAFEVKYYYGMARPEECSRVGPALTEYPEGCPRHPSLPQGHAAAASSVAALNEFFELTPEQKNVIWDTAYYWSCFRVFAGVHYPIDQVASFILCGMLDYHGDMALLDYNAVSVPEVWQ